ETQRWSKSCSAILWSIRLIAVIWPSSWPSGETMWRWWSCCCGIPESILEWKTAACWQRPVLWAMWSCAGSFWPQLTREWWKTPTCCWLPSRADQSTSCGCSWTTIGWDRVWTETGSQMRPSNTQPRYEMGCWRLSG
ncbi:hypothetical protein HDU91_003930, partial [Kappamyces sp. JEL0680]